MLQWIQLIYDKIMLETSSRSGSDFMTTWPFWTKHKHPSILIRVNQTPFFTQGGLVLMRKSGGVQVEAAELLLIEFRFFS